MKTLSEIVKWASENTKNPTLRLMDRLDLDSKKERIRKCLNELSLVSEQVALLKYLAIAIGRMELLGFLYTEKVLRDKLMDYVRTPEWDYGRKLGKWLYKRYGRRIYEGL